jgi:hypothetical protein
MSTTIFANDKIVLSHVLTCTRDSFIYTRSKDLDYTILLFLLYARRYRIGLTRERAEQTDASALQVFVRTRERTDSSSNVTLSAIGREPPIDDV